MIYPNSRAVGITAQKMREIIKQTVTSLCDISSQSIQINAKLIKSQHFASLYHHLVSSSSESLALLVTFLSPSSSSSRLGSLVSFSSHYFLLTGGESFHSRCSSQGTSWDLVDIYVLISQDLQIRPHHQSPPSHSSRQNVGVCSGILGRSKILGEEESQQNVSRNI